MNFYTSATNPNRPSLILPFLAEHWSTTDNSRKSIIIEGDQATRNALRPYGTIFLRYYSATTLAESTTVEPKTIGAIITNN